MNSAHQHLLSRRHFGVGCVAGAVGTAVGMSIAVAEQGTSTSRATLPVTRHRSAKVDGINMFYRESGPRDAPVVLLLHGEPSWSYLYRKVIPVLVAAALPVVRPVALGVEDLQRGWDLADEDEDAAEVVACAPALASARDGLGELVSLLNSGDAGAFDLQPGADLGEPEVGDVGLAGRQGEGLGFVLPLDTEGVEGACPVSFELGAEGGAAVPGRDGFDGHVAVEGVFARGDVVAAYFELLDGDVEDVAYAVHGLDVLADQRGLLGWWTRMSSG